MLKRFTAFCLGIIFCLILLELSLSIVGLVLRTGKNLENRHAGSRSASAITIACMGESITHSSYPLYLEDELRIHTPEQHYRVLDKSMLASDSNYITAVLPQILAKDAPDIVTVMTGVNDDKDPVLFEKEIRPFSFRHSRVYRLWRFLAPLVVRDTEKLGLWTQRQETDIWIQPAINAKELLTRIESGTITDYELRKLWDFYLDSSNFGEAEKIWNLLKANDNGENYFIARTVRMLVPQNKYAQAKSLLEEFTDRNGENDITAMLVTDIINSLENNLAPQTLLNAYPDIINAPEVFEKLKNPAQWIQKEGFYHDLISYLETNGHHIQAKTIAIQSRHAFPRSALLTHALIRLYKQTNDFGNIERLLNEQETLEIFGRDWVLAGLAACFLEQGKTAAAQDYLSRLDSQRPSPVTVGNCRIIIRQILAAGKVPVIMSYPNQSVAPLQAQLADAGKTVYFIDNGPVIRTAVEKQGYNTVFTDMYGGNFGHLTNYGSQLLARHIASALIKNKIIRQNETNS